MGTEWSKIRPGVSADLFDVLSWTKRADDEWIHEQNIKPSVNRSTRFAAFTADWAQGMVKWLHLVDLWPLHKPVPITQFPHSPTPSYQQGDQWRERLRIGARSFAFLRSGELTRSRPPITTPADERAVKERKEREKKKERKDTFQRVWMAAAVRSKLSFDRNFKDEVKSHIRKKAQFLLLSQRFLSFSVLEFRDFTSSILIFSSISMWAKCVCALNASLQ